METALFETLAGTGATLVAIIGGFALSKWLSIENEIQALDHRIFEVGERSKTADSMAAEAQATYIQQLIHEELVKDKKYPEMLLGSAEGGLTPDQALRVVESHLPQHLRDSDRPAVIEVVELWLGDARLALSDGWLRSVTHGKRKDEWIQDRSTAPDNLMKVPTVWRTRYAQIVEKNAADYRRSLANGPFPSISGLVVEDPVLPGLLAAVGQKNQVSNAQPSEKLRDIRDRAREHRADRAAELRLAHDLRLRITHPAGARATIGILCSTFAVTVLPGVGIMASAAQSVSPAVIAATLMLYGLGVAVLFSYMWWTGVHPRPTETRSSTTSE